MYVTSCHQIIVNYHDLFFAGLISPTTTRFDEETTTPLLRVRSTREATGAPIAPNFTKHDKYIHNPRSGTCYMRYKTPKLSWEDARAACENEGYDVRFATFKTQEAAQFIIDDYQNAIDGGNVKIIKNWKHNSYRKSDVYFYHYV